MVDPETYMEFHLLVGDPKLYMESVAGIIL
jgi:hypothetical protein